MSEPVIIAEGLGKTYRLYDRPADRFWEIVGRRARHRAFHALDDVSFTLPRGEALGIVGQNGAGKSTLLKILAGITTPSAGTVRVAGKVAAILELGAGFHPELTGRQNIVLNAALLGLGEAEVAARLPDIIGFSELGDFIDQPVKAYSTGMAMRLAFSIATQVEPDVLIIDEALSVGDGYFQKKCVDRLLEFVAKGGTILFCSHAMYYVTSLCRHALWLRDGRVAAFGAAQEVVAAYENHLLRREAPAAPEAEPQRPAPLRLTGGVVRGQEGEERQRFSPGDAWALEIVWTSAEPWRPVHLGVGVNRSDGLEVCSFSTQRDGLAPLRDVEQGRIVLEMPALPLIKGEFDLYLFLLDEEGLHIYDQKIIEHAFRVDSPGYRFGVIDPVHRWETAVAPAAAMALGTEGAPS